MPYAQLSIIFRLYRAHIIMIHSPHYILPKTYSPLINQSWLTIDQSITNNTNAADIRLTIRVMEQHFSCPRDVFFVIVTQDGFADELTRNLQAMNREALWVDAYHGHIAMKLSIFSRFSILRPMVHVIQTICDEVEASASVNPSDVAFSRIRKRVEVMLPEITNMHPTITADDIALSVYGLITLHEQSHMQSQICQATKS
jgi:hypothetical protein